MSELNQVIGVHVYECGWVGRHMQYVIYRKISDLTIQTDKEFKFTKRLSMLKNLKGCKKITGSFTIRRE